jgi:hypothetical protein
MHMGKAQRAAARFGVNSVEQVLAAAAWLTCKQQKAIRGQACCVRARLLVRHVACFCCAGTAPQGAPCSAICIFQLVRSLELHSALECSWSLMHRCVQFLFVVGVFNLMHALPAKKLVITCSWQQHLYGRHLRHAGLLRALHSSHFCYFV